MPKLSYVIYTTSSTCFIWPRSSTSISSTIHKYINASPTSLLYPIIYIIHIYSTYILYIVYINFIYIKSSTSSSSTSSTSSTSTSSTSSISTSSTSHPTPPSRARVRVRYHPTLPRLILPYPVQVSRFQAYHAAPCQSHDAMCSEVMSRSVFWSDPVTLPSGMDWTIQSQKSWQIKGQGPTGPTLAMFLIKFQSSMGNVSVMANCFPAMDGTTGSFPTFPHMGWRRSSTWGAELRLVI